MAIKFKSGIKKMFSAARKTIAVFPVETGIVLYTYIFGIDNAELAPLVFALAYILNVTFPPAEKNPEGDGGKRQSGWRWTYYLSGTIVLLQLAVNLDNWIMSPAYPVSIIIGFLGVLACRRARDNKQFAAESINYLINAILAFVFTSIALVLACAIYYSTIAIFGLDDYFLATGHDDFFVHAAKFCYILVTPILLLSFVYSNIWNGKYPSSRFLDVLLNFIITPALLIYTVILYLYFIKIAGSWSLPQGGIAIMVFVFTTLAIIIKGWQPLLNKRYYDWFFDRFSLISIPAVIMFWIGVCYRVDAYGLTAFRVYMIACGVIMTLALAMFFRKGRGSYLTVTLSSIAILALITYIPPVSAENLGIKSQTARLIESASALGMMDDNGMFKPAGQRPEYDPELDDEYKAIYNMLSYLTEYNEPKFGLENRDEFYEEYRGNPKRYTDPDHISISYHKTYYEIDVGRYRKLYPIGYRGYNDKYKIWFDIHSDMLFVKRIINDPKAKPEPDSFGVVRSRKISEPLLEIPLDTLLEKQFAAAGYDTENLPGKDEVKNGDGRLFTLEHEGRLYLFSSFSVQRQNGVTKLNNLDLEYVLE